MTPAARDTALHALLPVERLLRRADPAAVPDLLELRVALESTAGRTVTRGRAARFLALTQTSVDRWIADGAIPTVIDIDGKTMVPTRELVRLRVEMDAARWQGAQRPLGVVVRQRRTAAAALPVETFIVPSGDVRHGHRRAEITDLAVHRLIEHGLTPLEIAIAQWQLETARAEGRLHPSWYSAWREGFDAGEDRIHAMLVEDSADAASLRQTSPFKGQARHEDRRRLFDALDAERAA